MARVLLVDDDEDSCELLALLLERHGFEVRSSACVADAKAALGSEVFDVLLADWNLPDGNGHHLLAEGRPASLRFAAVLSGHSGPEHRAQSERSGFDAHLAKPVDLNELIRLIGARTGPTKPGPER